VIELSIRSSHCWCERMWNCQSVLVGGFRRENGRTHHSIDSLKFMIWPSVCSQARLRDACGSPGIGCRSVQISFFNPSRFHPKEHELFFAILTIITEPFRPTTRLASWPCASPVSVRHDLPSDRSRVVSDPRQQYNASLQGRTEVRYAFLIGGTVL